LRSNHPHYHLTLEHTFPALNPLIKVAAADTLPIIADFVQELYLKELKAYKAPAVKESDSEGQVQIFNIPQTPKSPEEADLAGNLKEYESMAVEIEGQDASSSATGAVLPDWLEAEEEDAEHH
jgi:F-type H+-transporting ATPase subunit h